MSFAPLHALLGGVLLGLSAVLLMALLGRIAGVSGMAAELLPPLGAEGAAGRAAFLGGLVAAPPATLLATGSWPEMTIEAGPARLLLAGLLVGFGAAWGSGCTSGHGVCGLARRSRRSVVAVATFMATAMLTLFLLRHAP